LTWQLMQLQIVPVLEKFLMLAKNSRRYKAVIRSISGVYSSEYKSDKDLAEAKALVTRFAEKEVVNRG